MAHLQTALEIASTLANAMVELGHLVNDSDAAADKATRAESDAMSRVARAHHRAEARRGRAASSIAREFGAVVGTDAEAANCEHMRLVPFSALTHADRLVVFCARRDTVLATVKAARDGHRRVKRQAYADFCMNVSELIRDVMDYACAITAEQLTRCRADAASALLAVQLVPLKPDAPAVPTTAVPPPSAAAEQELFPADTPLSLTPSTSRPASPSWDA